MSTMFWAEANSNSQAARNAALLVQLGATGTTIAAGTVEKNLIVDRKVTGVTYRGEGVGVVVHQDWLGAASIAVVDASGISDANDDNVASFIVSGGDAFSGTLSGSYVWKGVQIVANSNELEKATTRNETSVTADFGSGGKSFTVTPGTGAAFGLGGTGSVDLATGRLSGTGFTLAGTGVSTSAAATFEGRIHGLDGGSLAGVFANSAALDGRYYAGAIVASGAIDTTILYGSQRGVTTSQGALLVRGEYALAGRAEADILFVLPDGTNALERANHASSNVRRGALLANIAPSFGASTRAQVPTIADDDAALDYTSRTGQFTHGGASVTATSYEDRDAIGQLLVIEGAGPLIAFGGTAVSNDTIDGDYNWTGVQVIASAGVLNNETVGRFSASATFTGAQKVDFIYTGDTPASGAIRLVKPVGGGQNRHKPGRVRRVDNLPALPYLARL